MVTRLEAETKAFWEAQLAWRGHSPYCDGKTTGWIIEELRAFCHFQSSLGAQADNLLEDVIQDKRRRPLSEGFSAPLYSLHDYSQSKTQNNGLTFNTKETLHA